MRPQRTSRRFQVLAALFLAALYLFPRLMHLDASVTTDEPIWLGRSANFYLALFRGNFADTFQFAHPGVPTMWAGMIGYWFAFPDYAREYTNNFELTFEIHQRIRASGLSELDVLIAARMSKVVLQAIFFLIAIVYCHRRFGGVVATLTGIIIALDPFLIAHDRLLHVDGLFAITSFAAVMALADAFVTGWARARPWVIAGILAAFAWLTRSTGIVLVAVLAGWMLIDLVTERWSADRSFVSRFRHRLRPALIWGAAAFLATVAMWPALWVAPLRTLDFMLDWTTKAAERGHALPTFFDGTIQYGDPGLLFYPVTLLWRLTPLTLVGVALFTGFLITDAMYRHLSGGRVQTIGIATTFAVLYLIGMSLGEKKFDRYILPVYPIVDLIAALGFATAATTLIHTVTLDRRIVMATTLALIVIVQGGSYWSARLYPLDYYNPLLGGLDRAINEVRVGWGEAHKEAAEFILARAGGEEVTVRMSGTRGPLLYFLPEPVVVQPYRFETVADWESTDYYVSSIQQWQRDIRDEVIDYLEQFEPVKVVTIDGVPFIKVYKLNGIPPPPFLPEATGRMHTPITGWESKDARRLVSTLRTETSPNPTNLREFLDNMQPLARSLR